MKKLIYSLAIITFVSTLTSCTADEIQPINPTKQAIKEQYFQKNDSIVPPIITPTKP